MTIQPKMSIIIAVKNAKEGLLRTLNSIRGQTYKPIEVIVVDGGSQDGTVDIIQQHLDLITHYISEPDRGISDAFNKGLKLATGHYINFQGAGDTFFAPTSIEQLFNKVTPDCLLVCGKVQRVKEDGITPLWIAPKRMKRFRKRSLLFKMALPHQALFTHRRFFSQYGEFDLSAKFAMDYELLLRAYKDFPKTSVKNMIVARWQAGGIGSDRIEEIFTEYHRIKMQHHVAAPWILKLIDRWTRFKYRMKTHCLKVAY